MKNEKNENPTLSKMAVSGSFQIGDKFELGVYGEICCDDCNEIIHNHIDCPVCEKQYSSTDQYCNLSDETEISCDNCLSVFKKISESWYYDCNVELTKASLNCH